MLFFAIRNTINLELQTIISTFMRKFGLNGLAHRIPAIEPVFNDLFHDRNIPNISKKTIHLNHIIQSESYNCQSSFHVVKCAINLFFDRAANITNAVTKETEIACLDYSRMYPSFVNIVSFNHAIILLYYFDNAIIAQMFDKNKWFYKFQFGNMLQALL